MFSAIEPCQFHLIYANQIEKYFGRQGAFAQAACFSMSFSQSCSFQDILNTQCGNSRGIDTLVLLSECNANISSHLVSCHLSQCINITESDLILQRAGIRTSHGTSSSCHSSMTICPKHRHHLGRFWRPPKSCQYPTHSGKTTSVAGRHVINLKMVEEIYLLFGKSVALGSRK